MQRPFFKCSPSKKKRPSEKLSLLSKGIDKERIRISLIGLLSKFFCTFTVLYKSEHKIILSSQSQRFALWKIKEKKKKECRWNICSLIHLVTFRSCSRSEISSLIPVNIHAILHYRGHIHLLSYLPRHRQATCIASHRLSCLLCYLNSD